MTQHKNEKPRSNLTKGTSPKTSPELKERDLDKVTGGAKILGVDGESAIKDHK